MKRWVAAILAAASATACHAAPASVQDYMGQAPVKADARIAYGPAPAQVVDLFLPKTKGPYPVVVLLHGGCFLAEYQGLPQTSAIAADLAKRGYAVWNVEYRKLGEPGAGYPGTFLDVADAVDRLKVEARKYRLDPKRVVALGHSAGGHLALWAAARGRLPKTSPLWRARPQAIRAVVSLGGIGDLEGQGDVFAGACGPEPIPRIIGLATRQNAYADTSPAALLPTGVPVTMISGELDSVMPPATGRAYVARLTRAGDKGEAISIPGASHFDVVIPTTAAWQVVVGALDRQFRALR
ncbi:alpha/beta hydrolase [Phenylobacterium sp.]|uniref:alpha/beta hydrolase family protein n=1 Tax=Phenylobacterium sp. TaxID=1871053 RepID=UPI0025EB0033|nr:alpha/beta hydrolase [Phenylobacterium sp.]